MIEYGLRKYEGASSGLVNLLVHGRDSTAGLPKETVYGGKTRFVTTHRLGYTSASGERRGPCSPSTADALSSGKTSTRPAASPAQFMLTAVMLSFRVETVQTVRGRVTLNPPIARQA